MAKTYTHSIQNTHKKSNKKINTFLNSVLKSCVLDVIGIGIVSQNSDINFRSLIKKKKSEFFFYHYWQ